jgi:hypothetical protein
MVVASVLSAFHDADVISDWKATEHLKEDPKR